MVLLLNAHLPQQSLQQIRRHFLLLLFLVPETIEERECDIRINILIFMVRIYRFDICFSAQTIIFRHSFFFCCVHRGEDCSCDEV